MATAPAPYSITAVTYNAQNLPVSLTRSGVTSTYRYDDAGQRITKQVGAGNTEVYLRDGATTLAVFTVNGSGTPVSWYFNVLAEGGIVGRQPNTGNRRYYHFDMLGSTRSVVEGPTVVESYDLEPWGLLMPGRTLGSGTKEGFTGKEQDSETGLDYFGARFYMPALGRWSGVDPLASAFEGWNPYNYVLNSPNSSVDPDGRASRDMRSLVAAAGGRMREGCFFASCSEAAASPAFDSRSLVATGGGPCASYPAGQCPEMLQAAERAQQALNSTLIGIGGGVSGLFDLATGGATTALWKAGSGMGENGTLSAEERRIEALKGFVGLGGVAFGSPGAGARVVIVAKNGTRITGIIPHAIDRAIIGDGARRRGVRPQAILDALKNPKRIVSGVDHRGLPYEIFTGTNARVVVNPQSGKIISVNPLSRAGGHAPTPRGMSPPR